MCRHRGGQVLEIRRVGNAGRDDYAVKSHLKFWIHSAESFKRFSFVSAVRDSAISHGYGKKTLCH